jgi:hypothetical protein
MEMLSVPNLPGRGVVRSGLQDKAHIAWYLKKTTTSRNVKIFLVVFILFEDMLIIPIIVSIT